MDYIAGGFSGALNDALSNAVCYCFPAIQDRSMPLTAYTLISSARLLYRTLLNAHTHSAENSPGLELWDANHQ